MLDQIHKNKPGCRVNKNNTGKKPHVERENSSLNQKRKHIISNA